jgi:hypothetical protein
MKEAMIYGRNNGSGSLTDYQKAINKAAGQLALVNPEFLTKRGKILVPIYNEYILQSGGS